MVGASNLHFAVSFCWWPLSLLAKMTHQTIKICRIVGQQRRSKYCCVPTDYDIKMKGIASGWCIEYTYIKTKFSGHTNANRSLQVLTVDSAKVLMIETKYHLQRSIKVLSWLILDYGLWWSVLMCYWLLSGWWFGTWILFSPIAGMMIQSDFHILQGGWNHQPVIMHIKHANYMTWRMSSDSRGWAESGQQDPTPLDGGTFADADFAWCGEDPEGLQRVWWVYVKCRRFFMLLCFGCY